MSVWGIGAPRSGTLTLAYLLDGVHEPPPGIVLEAVAYWRTEGKPRENRRGNPRRIRGNHGAAMNVLSIGYHNGPDYIGWPGHSVPGPCWRFARGFEALGHTVRAYDIRTDQFTQRALDELEYDVCWLAGQMFRWFTYHGTWIPKIAERMPIVINYCDQRDEPETWFDFAAEYTELVLHAAGGRCLESLVGRGFKRAGFMPGPAYEWHDVRRVHFERTVPWFFSGSDTAIGDGYRRGDLEALVDEAGGKRVNTPGMFGLPHVAGRAHAELMYKAQRGLAVSHFHDRPKYTSQRTWQYMRAGIDVACRWFEGCELVLPPEAVVYRDRDELARIAHEPRDHARAMACRNFVRERYSCTELARVVLAYLAGDDPGVPWAEVSS